MTRIEQLRRDPIFNRALALGLLIGLLLVLAYAVAELLASQHRKYDEAIETRMRIIAGYQRVAANRAAYEAAIERAGKLDTGRHYLKSSSPALAAAEIQDIAQAALALSQMKQSSVNIAPHRDSDGRRMVTVNYTLRGTPEAMQKMLYALETSLPQLFIDNLSIRAAIHSRNWRPIPNVEPEVQVQFDLYGYARIGKKS